MGSYMQQVLLECPWKRAYSSNQYSSAGLQYNLLNIPVTSAILTNQAGKCWADFDAEFQTKMPWSTFNIKCYWHHEWGPRIWKCIRICYKICFNLICFVLYMPRAEFCTSQTWCSVVAVWCQGTHFHLIPAYATYWKIQHKYTSSLMCHPQWYAS